MEEAAKFNISQILPIIMVFVVAGIGVTYGLDVMEEAQDDMGEDACAARADTYTLYNETANQCYNSSGTHVAVGTSDAFNASEDSISGVAKFPEKFGTLATVVVAAIILGVLITYLALS